MNTQKMRTRLFVTVSVMLLLLAALIVGCTKVDVVSPGDEAFVSPPETLPVPPAPIVESGTNVSAAASDANDSSVSNGSSVNGAIDSVADSAPASSAPEVTFSLTGENFKFVMDGHDAPELRVTLGEKVRIEFANAQGFHDWVLDELNARTAQIRAGESSSVEFVADKKGTFEYYCSVGSHRQMGMKGRFVVE